MGLRHGTRRKEHRCRARGREKIKSKSPTHTRNVQRPFSILDETPPRSEEAKAKGGDKEDTTGNEGKIEQGQSGNRLVDVEERNVGVVGWKYVSGVTIRHV